MKNRVFRIFMLFMIFGTFMIWNTKPSCAKKMRFFLGDYNISAYSPESNDPIGTRETSTGAVATANKTIAVDMFNPIAHYGDILEINGIRYTVEDCGNLEKYNRQLDIFMNTGSEADNWGVRTREVYIIRDVDEDEFEIPEATIQAMKEAYENFIENEEKGTY